MGDNILITGGAGYVGSIMVPELLKAGHKVTVVDNFMFRQNTLLDCCAYDGFQVVRGDARDRGLMAKMVKGKDYIFPLAALVGVPLCNRDEIGTVSTNSDAVRLLCELASAEQRIMIPVTNSGYGVGKAGVFCTEKTPLNPISTYGRTKVEAEEAVLSRKNSISFRLATVFGMSPRMRMDLLVNDFTFRAVRDRFIGIFEGHFKRNFVHVRDVARAFQHGMANFELMRGEAYNVGLSEANLSKLELCARIKELVPELVYLEAPVGEDPDKRNYIVSNEKLEKTGFKTAHNLELGIRELIKGYTILSPNIYANV
ncbi:MAG: NAD-dependent epimerase/dehydratase [Planctomycetes bacterium]|nr:NAD-dependent epimerase/dehydratase [Planctomycetota bacterium]